ncbi:sulfurtransferase [Leeia aquatica]|uniref:Sulfurtransferase n=1 Tax=Leeia aquatica TaxID=2725557 RepID=A0A847SD25_9NEIS|nr:sulfurtransferase [Leeia aquatica]NLR75068.1 sulfurtransferase [Leeia aquatica]
MYQTLIDAASLQALQGQVCLLDCSHQLTDLSWGRAQYAAGHLPGAQFASLEDDLSAAKTGRNGRHPLPERAHFAETVARWGITPRTQVVAYDSSGGMYAARLWWMLRWLGHQAVAVLDGGVAAWQAAGGALTTELPQVVPAAPYPLQPADEPVRVETVLTNLQHPAFVVLDARAPGRFAGEGETMDPVGGHIPGARNFFFQNNLQADGRFKPADVLRQQFEQLLAGVAPSELVHQCGSGVTACHNLLAMSHAGLTGSRLYAGSWSEWCSDASRPVATGTEA